MNRITKSNLKNSSGIAPSILAALMFITLTINAIAADGDVVAGFAPQLLRGGVVSQIIVQPDGKILIWGQFSAINGTLRPSLARLNADGSLDQSFVPPAIPNSTGILLQPDGSGWKIIIRGTSIRLNSNGTVDPTFQPARTFYLAMLPGGKIVASGMNFSYMTGLVRMSANGALEVNQSSASGGNVVYITLAAAQADGKIIFAGNFFNYFNQQRPGFARLNADWSLDTAFPTGSATSTSSGLFARINEIAPASNGKIYIAGDFQNYDGIARPGLARLNPDGSLDTSFDPQKPDGSVNKIIAMPDGSLLIAGAFNTIGGIRCSRIARLKLDGSPDGAFDTGQEFNGSINSAGIQADGKILVGGSFNKIGNTSRLGIARLNADGSPDSTFIAGASSAESALIKFIRRTADGKFIIAGDFIQVGGIERPGLARLHADGSLDASFIPSGSADPNLVAAEPLPDGKLIIAGNANASRSVYRLNADGSADATFKNAAFAGTLETLVVLSDGRLLVGGSLKTSSNQATKLLVARLNADGSPDPTFTFNSQDDGFITAVSPMADGKILVGGRFRTIGGAARVNFARLNGNGSVDAGFDMAADDIGFQDIQFTPYLSNKILVSGGFSKLAGAARNRMALLNADGSLDAAFMPALGLNAQLTSVLPDGRILVSEGSRIMRLNANGSPDFVFSFPVWSAGGESKGITTSLLALPDGRAIAGGAFYQAGSAKIVRPLLVMFEAGGPTVALASSTLVSAANYRPTVAGASIVSIFGSGLASATESARTSPLPTTLNGVQVKFVPTDSIFNDDLLLPLFFVSERQINCHLRYLSPNEGFLLVENNGVVVAAMPINSIRVAPGIFTADASGKGYPAAQVLRVRADGSQSYEPIVTRNAAGQLVGRPIDLGPDTEQVFLVMYGTGSYDRSSLDNASVLIGNEAAQIQYLGFAPGFVGLDQINVRIPRSLKGVNADVEVKLTVDGIAANTVKVYIQ